MYSTAFWCLIVVYCFFWLHCVTTVTPFIERSEKFGADLNFGQKSDILVATGPGPRQIEVTSLHFVL